MAARIEHCVGVLLLAPLLVAMTGCGGELVAVSGTVTLDDQPLAGCTVTFTPVGGGQPASGRTDDKGAFVLSTRKAEDGIKPGDYKVTVHYQPPTGGSFAPQGTVQNPKDPQEQIDAVRKFVEDSGGKQPFPAVYSNVDKTPFRVTVPPKEPIRLVLKKTGP